MAERTVSILCAARNSVYKSLPSLEVYDVVRDCRTFDGSTPIVAHPPCRAWSAFCAQQSKAPPEEKELAPWCVSKLKEVGGVLEHPAHSRLWNVLNLPPPGIRNRDIWTLEVWQQWWGYPMKKATWLLICGIAPREIPDIPYRIQNSGGDRRRQQLMSRNQRAATNQAFAQWLVDTARRTTGRLKWLSGRTSS
jgi:hypothetical protein